MGDEGEKIDLLLILFLQLLVDIPEFSSASIRLYTSFRRRIGGGKILEDQKGPRLVPL